MADLTVTQHMEHLLQHQLISPQGQQGYAFRHALLREAVYGTLLRRERRAVHGAVAQTLESLYAGKLDEHLADLAHHYYENEDWAKALAYAQQAGALAQRRSATHEAHTHYTHALAAAEHLGLRPPPDLYRARGQVREVLGDFDGARADHETALAAARAAQQPAAEWQTLLDLGYLWTGRDYAQTGRYFQHALALARTLGDPATLGHSLNRLGNWHLNREEIPAALAHHTEALALFERHPDQRGLAETLDLLGLTTGYHGDVHTGRRYYERALTLFRALDDRLGQASSLAVMAGLGPAFAGDIAEPAVNLREAHFLVDQSLKLCSAIGWRAGEVFARLSLSSIRLCAGAFDDALLEVNRGAALAAEIGHDQWLTLSHLIRGGLDGERGQFAAARTATLAACAGAEQLNSVLWQRYSRGQLAGLCLETNDLAGAEAALAGQIDHTRLPDTASLRQMLYAHGQLALARGDTAEAIHVAERLRASIPNPTPGCVIPRVSKLHAEALAAQGQLEAAADLLRLALPAAEEIRTITWRLHASLAAVYAAQGHVAAAAAQAAAARHLITALAATLPTGAQRDTFTHMALARLAQPWPGGTVPA